jgi:GT2 family glycosyltransferase
MFMRESVDPVTNCRPLVSVVVPNWNGRRFLAETLEGLRAQQFPSFEAIVVDDGSTDGSPGWLRECFPWVIVERLARNSGFASAANAGAGVAQGRYVAFLNSDAVPRPDWLAELVACLERHPAAAAVDSKILRLGEPDEIDGAGDAMTWSLKAYRRGAGQPWDPWLEREERIFAASGTAALWRAEAFSHLGGFDDRFFAYYEDVDLGFRALRGGYECWFTPLAVVMHRGGASAGPAARRLESFDAVRNRWAMIIKNAPLSWLVRKGHVIVLGEAASIARAVARGDGFLHFAAYGDVLRSIRPWWLSRQQIRRTGHLSLAVARPLVRRNFPPIKNSLRRRRSREQTVGALSMR